MTTFLYFAYGSNMLAARLQARCKSARPLCIVFANHYALEFSKPSTDQSGKGHLTKSDAAEQRQPGVLFGVDTAERDALDRFEGRGYLRDDQFRVFDLTNRSMEATTYRASETKSGLKPYDWYLALIVAGARENGFDADELSKLLSVIAIPDPDESRQTKLDAEKLLRAAGYTSLRNVFER